MVGRSRSKSIGKCTSLTTARKDLQMNISNRMMYTEDIDCRSGVNNGLRDSYYGEYDGFQQQQPMMASGAGN